MNSISTYLDHQNDLKCALQAGCPSYLEHLAASLLGRLLKVSVFVAHSGFQHGADAGTAGEQGRRLRLECKKYGDSSNLNERQLLGEIDQALNRDKALEAWVLITTRHVSEQIRQSLVQKGERIGVPVLIIDWAEEDKIAPLAALCAFAPDLVKQKISEAAGAAARALQPLSGEAIDTLRTNTQSWCLGFESLRAKSHECLDRIWTSPKASNAKFGQDAAGGNVNKKVRRENVHDELLAWWQGDALKDAPVAMVGLDGVGKTWAALAWLVERKEEIPIMLTIPSSTATAATSISETGFKQLLANCLHEITGRRNSEHWLRRLEFMLKRPVEEGPVLMVFFD